MEFAADLGAEVVRFQAADVASGPEHVARSRRITDLFVGHHPRGGMDRLLRPSPVDQLADHLPDLQIHIVGPGTEPDEAFIPGAP
jgi:K+-sensing histidine kinase KdpD